MASNPVRKQLPRGEPGKQRRAGFEGVTVVMEGAGTAAGVVEAFEENHSRAALDQAQRSAQAPETGPDHGNVERSCRVGHRREESTPTE